MQVLELIEQNAWSSTPERKGNCFLFAWKTARVSYFDMHCVFYVFCAFSLSMHKKLNLLTGQQLAMVHFYSPLPITRLNNYNLSYHLSLSLTFGYLCPAAHLCLSLYLLINWFVLKITLKISNPELWAVSLHS
jgi:hypothetical protein